MKKLFISLLLVILLPLLTSASMADSTNGKILLQVEENGEAWYVVPQVKQRAYLGRPANAFQIMRNKDLGIFNTNLNEIPEYPNYSGFGST